MRRLYSRPGRKISVVVPVYNEIGILEKFHDELVSSLLELRQPYEIIYVDDYSDDGTYDWLASRASNLELTSLAGKQGEAIRSSMGLPRSFSVARNDKELAEQDIVVLRKKGKKGKAYSLVEGFEKANGTILVMIDGDLQYSPSFIPGMYKRLAKAEIVVSDRQYKHVSFVRRSLSWLFRYFFGMMLFGLNYDIQSGLKVFKREVFETVKFIPSSAWTFDLEFLQRARHAGFAIHNYKIIFSPRTNDDSKINLFLSSAEIGGHALRLKLKCLLPFIIRPYLIKGWGIKSGRT